MGRRNALHGVIGEWSFVGMKVRVHCRMTFGLNNWGQLGNGRRSEEVEAPERITFFDDKEIAQAALSQHATAVLTKDGCV